ncbi:hypothetical protein RCL_jg19294.t1 [Rhizophagus clarus]|uniref:Uncharacterized protein n=1 Tax=Rhizophagus clarus TaxID=94130 RepID=A0A8H3LZW7_9GLOM|nr:hypothetical protein RCL_jg19294.t1 [Rhizophagus clarus]
MEKYGYPARVSSTNRDEKRNNITHKIGCRWGKYIQRDLVTVQSVYCAWKLITSTIERTKRAQVSQFLKLIEEIGKTVIVK